MDRHSHRENELSRIKVKGTRKLKWIRKSVGKSVVIIIVKCSIEFTEAIIITLSGKSLPLFSEYWLPQMQAPWLFPAK